MNRIIRAFFVLIGFCTAMQLRPLDLYGISFFTPRSQSTNLARHMAGKQAYINRHDTKNLYGLWQATVAYQETFRPERLAEYFFSTNQLEITGSMVSNRCQNDLLADYFGLSPTFSSRVKLEPHIRSCITDLSFYFGERCWYFELFIPIVWTKTEFRIEERIANNGTDNLYPAGYMGESEIPAPYSSFSQALRSGVNFGDVKALQAGKLCCSQTDSGISELHASFGYNFLQCETKNYGVALHLAAPTGSRPKSEYLLEPIVGNGKHGEFGINLHGAWLLWERGGTQDLHLFAAAQIAHLFKARQRRSFDFVNNGFASRYILIKEFDTNGMYTGNTIPAINISTLCCDVRIDVQLDAVLMIAYHHNYWEFDFGYNGWVRSKEKICKSSCNEHNCSYECARSTKSRFGFKGIQNTHFNMALNPATQSNATIHGNDFSDQMDERDDTSPVLLSLDTIDFTSAASPTQVAHKFFWNINHHWHDCDDELTTHILGFGGEVGFEGERPKDTLPNKPTPTEWGIWITYMIGF